MSPAPRISMVAGSGMGADILTLSIPRTPPDPLQAEDAKSAIIARNFGQQLLTNHHP